MQAALAIGQQGVCIMVKLLASHKCWAAVSLELLLAVPTYSWDFNDAVDHLWCLVTHRHIVPEGRAHKSDSTHTRRTTSLDTVIISGVALLCSALVA